MNELKYAECILKIAETRNISRAAEALFITQPAMSRILHYVEKAVGFEIFDRKAQPLNPTARGTLYINFLSMIREMETEMKKQVSLLDDELPQILRVGMVPERGIGIYSKIFPELMQEENHIKFMIQNGYSKELETLFVNGKLDICIVNGPIQNKIENQIVLDEEEILLVVGKKNTTLLSELAEQETAAGHVDLRKLKSIGMVVLNKGQRMRQVAENILRASQIQGRDIIEVYNLGTAVQLVATSRYASFIPVSALLKSSVREEICAFHLGSGNQTWELRLLYAKSSLKPIADTISEKYRKLCRGETSLITG